NHHSKNRGRVVRINGLDARNSVAKGAGAAIRNSMILMEDPRFLARLGAKPQKAKSHDMLAKFRAGVRRLHVFFLQAEGKQRINWGKYGPGIHQQMVRISGKFGYGVPPCSETEIFR